MGCFFWVGAGEGGRLAGGRQGGNDVARGSRGASGPGWVGGPVRTNINSADINSADRMLLLLLMTMTKETILILLLSILQPLNH